MFLRPLGTPLTIGLAGLAIASLVQGGLDLGWIPPTQQEQVGLILIAVPFVLQLVACVLSFLARDGAAGASLGVLATTWLGLGLLHLASAPGATSNATGLLLLAAAAVLALSAAAVARAKPLVAAAFGLTAARFALAGIYELTVVSAWQEAAGIVSVIVLAIAAYDLLAFELEGQRRRPLLPTLRRGPGREALFGTADEQVEGVIHEPGVRRTT